MNIQVGPYRLGRGLLDHIGVSGGSFASVYEATDDDGRSFVAKIARPTGGGSYATEVWGSLDDGRRPPVHVPAVARRLGIGEERPIVDLSGPDLDQILVNEAGLLERDGGQLLPRSYGVWETNQDGRAIPILVMERLPGRQGVRSIDDIVALLTALAAAAARDTISFHGDLKLEHIFVEAEGRVRVCDPAPRLADPSLQAFTPLYNPQGHRGPAADAAACATIIRHLLAGAPVAWRWCTQLLDQSEPPSWAHSHRAALAALRAELDDASPPPDDWTTPPLPDRFGQRAAAPTIDVAAPARTIVDPTSGVMSNPWPDPTSDGEDRTSGPGSQAEHLPRRMAGDGERRRVTTIGFQPVAPEGWFVKQSVTLLKPDGSANFIASTEPLASHLDTSTYSDSQLASLRREFPGFTEHSGGWLTLPSGHRAVWRQFSWTPPDGVEVTQLQVYVAEDGIGYTATGTTTSAMWPLSESTLHELMRTLEVHDRSARPAVPPAMGAGPPDPPP